MTSVAPLAAIMTSMSKRSVTVALACLLALSACRRKTTPTSDVDAVFPTGTFTLTLTEVSNTCGLDADTVAGGSDTLQLEGTENADLQVTLAGNTIGPTYVSATTLIFSSPNSEFYVNSSDGAQCTYYVVDTYTLAGDGNNVSGTDQAALNDPTGECPECAINYAVSSVKVGD